VNERLRIERLGARADGVAHAADGAVYIPYALPGETVLARREGSSARAHLVAVETAAEDRVAPFCPYFGACGGCLTQHVGEETYAAWKRGIVSGALAKAGLDAPVESLIDAHGFGRRRVTFHVRFKDGKARVGYMAVRSHDLVEVAFCPIAESALKESPRIALVLAGRLRASGKTLDLQVTATETGLDVDIRGHGPMSDRLRQPLVQEATDLDLARLSVHGDILVERRPPLVTMGRAQVNPPPGGFLQATRLGEERLAEIVVQACAGSRRIADLFAGCGPFALRLAEKHEVHAVEADGRSLASLDKAARNAPGLRQVTAEARDLFRRPLLAPELDRFDAVVMNPPRAGAEAQAKRLARSKVPLVVGVSCDAGTFVRDAAVLSSGGYRLERVLPVDQFKFTPHVEIVGLFLRKAARRL
jgi:23S rRNA (uracil1939-C5)-methyltransferase